MLVLALFVLVGLPRASLASGTTPNGIWGDKDLNVHLSYRNTIIKIDKASSLLTTVAGSDAFGYYGDNGPSTSARMQSPEGIWISPENNVFVADTGNRCIRTISSSGIISTSAGSGTEAQYSSIAATSVSIGRPTSVFGDSFGTVYITDHDHHVISKLSNGVLTRVVGTFKFGQTVSASATSSELNSPTSVWVDDTSGFMYIAETGSDRIRAVNIRTGAANYNPVPMKGVVGIFGERSLKYGRTMLYLTSSTENVVYIYDMLSGVKMVLAGSGSAGNGGNGVHAGAGTLNNPRGVWKEPLVDPNEEDTAFLYLVDKGNDKVRKLTWDLKIYDYYGGQAVIATRSPGAAPTVRPSLRPTVVTTVSPTDSPIKKSSDQTSSSSSDGAKNHSSSVLLIIIITVCVLSLLGFIVLCIFRFLYDWPRFPWERHGSGGQNEQPDNQFEFVTYRALPASEGSSPM